MISASIPVAVAASLLAVCFQHIIADCQQQQNEFQSDAPTMLLQSELVLSNQSQAQAELLQASAKNLRPFSDSDLNEMLREEQGENVRPPKGVSAPLDKTLFAKQGPPSLKELHPLTTSSAENRGVKRGIPIAKSVPFHNASNNASGHNDTNVIGSKNGSSDDAKSGNASVTDGPSHGR
eukprot:TRINITY_DN107155_c0_g1_i1.p2 TRINITY_DN107155_c0_g1~~TRINITY_DN107155_c0_g1_i1.p2  ORF type:complete len:179 (-),score=26.64 TRINITY_DN107155_c0_g1_i1:166-702(-)